MNAEFEGPSRPGGSWRRLHAALMPDYNGKAAAFWWAVCLCGALVVGRALWVLADRPPSVWLQVLGGMVAAMVAGLFPIRVPRSTNSFVAGEIAIFLLLLTLGPEAATVASSGEAAMGAFRSSKRWTSRLISPANTALSMAAAGAFYGWAHAQLDAFGVDASFATLSMAIMAALIYFLFSAIGISGVQRLKRDQPFLDIPGLVSVFRWIGLAFSASACVAGLLTIAYRQSGPSVLLAVLPLLTLFLVALHFYFRDQESRQEMRHLINDVAAREAMMASREADAAMRYMLELQASEARFHAAFTHAQIGMALMSFEGRILQANRALSDLLGFPQDDLAGSRLHDHVVDDERALLDHRLGLTGGAEFQGFSSEFSLRRRDGQVVWATLDCGFFTEPGATQPCLIVQMQDVTARRHAEASLQYLAYHDSLTGVPNRRRFLEVVNAAIERSRLDRTNAFAVLFIDFDGLKAVNESLGHKAGDDVLSQVTWRLQQYLRPGDVLARLGGDEFGVLVQVGESMHEVQVVVGRLDAALREPFQTLGEAVRLVPAIGVAFGDAGHETGDDLLRAADADMRSTRAGQAD